MFDVITVIKNTITQAKTIINGHQDCEIKQNAHYAAIVKKSLLFRRKDELLKVLFLVES